MTPIKQFAEELASELPEECINIPEFAKNIESKLTTYITEGLTHKDEVNEKLDNTEKKYTDLDVELLCIHMRAKLLLEILLRFGLKPSKSTELESENK